MPRLKGPNGVVVNVSDEQAARLGWFPADAKPETVKRKPAPRKKAAPKSDK